MLLKGIIGLKYKPYNKNNKCDDCSPFKKSIDKKK